MKILVTGGAGFIGQHLVKRLAKMNNTVLVLDNLLPQVHGEGASFPMFEGDVVIVRGDIRDRELIKSLFNQGLDIVYHLASLTGVGQSMYQFEQYVDTNCNGTALLLDAALTSRQRPKKIILSSSRAVYGEGRVYCQQCNFEFSPTSRTDQALVQHKWEHACLNCGADCYPLPSLEASPLNPTSIYGLTKYMQERLCEIFGDTYGIPITILRYFNVYGPGQSPINPYTGILSIFSRRLIQELGVDIYEDGREMRDFVYVDDVVHANVLAGESDEHGIFNICSGESVSVYDVAKTLTRLLDCSEDLVNVNSRYRVGDIRHGLGSWEQAGRILKYHPQVPLHVGLRYLLDWLCKQELNFNDDPDRRAQYELQSHGLFR